MQKIAQSTNQYIKAHNFTNPFFRQLNMAAIKDYKDLLNPLTKAFIHSYKPIKLFIYNYKIFPISVLDPVTKTLLLGDYRFSEGRYLFQVCTDPSATDLFLFPCDLDYFEFSEQKIHGFLEYYSGNEKRHIFYDTRDNPKPFPDDKSIKLKVSVNRRFCDKSVICIPYLEPVDNFFFYFNEQRPKIYELSFVGQHTPLREKLLKKISERCPSSRFIFRDQFFHDGLFPQHHKAMFRICPDKIKEKKLQRKEYIDILLNSKFALAIRGFRGLNSFRFFESLSLGVPPILVSSNCMLPFEEQVDYRQFSFQVDAEDPNSTEEILHIVSRVKSARYQQMRALARLYYDAYLSPHNFLLLIYKEINRRINDSA